MDSVPLEPDFSIQRDNEHILIRIFQKGRLFTFPFLLKSQKLFIESGYLFYSNIFLWAEKSHQNKSD